MSTMTVRIHQDTHRFLKELALQTGEAMADILAKALEEYSRQRFLQGLEEKASGRAELYARAAGLIGRFPDREGATDLADEHDRYLEDAFT